MSEKKLVLIVCKSAAGQMYLGVLLNRIWYLPVLAKTAEEGAHLSRSEQFSLILFDADIPASDRRQAVSMLKTEPSLKDLPLVVFITDDTPELSRSLLAQGCAAVLTKPLDLAIVYGVLARLSGQPRTTIRVPVKMRVEIEEGKPEAFLTSVNISEGGLYLRTAEPLPGGTVLHVKFTLPHDTDPIAVTAEVIRALPLGQQIESEPGMGLRFTGISEENLRRVRNFVQWDTMGDLEWKAGI
jgi:uncharacterized protein (TIGR02266 family)